MTVVRVEWGLNGIRALSGTSAVFVIVDVLSFSTTVDIAVSKGAQIYPFPLGDQKAAETAAAEIGAILAKPRKTAGEQFSLSPQSMLAVVAGSKLMLPSPNGSRLSLEIRDKPVLTGCLRNAVAVAKAARLLAKDGDIAIIPAGERWVDGSLRPAIEDWLGAGAIVDALGLPTSAEGEAAQTAFHYCKPRIDRLIRDSQSSRELIESGYAGDVELALEHDVSNVAPIIRQGAYQAC